MSKKERHEQLADAYLLVSEADHYMVGIVEKVTHDEMDAAEQVLIARQNDMPSWATASAQYRALDRALDLLACDRKQIRE